MLQQLDGMNNNIRYFYESDNIGKRDNYMQETKIKSKRNQSKRAVAKKKKQ